MNTVWIVILFTVLCSASAENNEFTSPSSHPGYSQKESELTEPEESKSKNVRENARILEKHFMETLLNNRKLEKKYTLTAGKVHDIYS